MVTNGELADALFQLAATHPPGDERVALLRAAYAVFDTPRELGKARRLPETIPLETLPVVTMLRGVASVDALAAVVARLAGPLPRRGGATRDGFLSAAEVEAILASSPNAEPRLLRGAIHWHTRASDGAVSLERMAQTCLRRGASWAVVADHTRGLECVNGLDAEGVAIQRRGVEQWNRRRGDELWLVQGLEAEILADGRLDLPRERRVGVLVIAAVHTELASGKDQTARLLRALAEPGVWALAHPQGRLFARRSGIRANWEVVFREAAERSIRLEINGFPRRQDLDPTLTRLADACGCNFLLASDAHHPRHLEFDHTALAIALAAGIGPQRIANFDRLDRLAEHRPDLPMPA